MSSADVIYGIGDVVYWAFENTMEPLADLPWRATLILGFVCFGYWMKKQVAYNKEAEANPDQLK